MLGFIFDLVACLLPLLSADGCVVGLEMAGTFVDDCPISYSCFANMHKFGLTVWLCIDTFFSNFLWLDYTNDSVHNHALRVLSLKLQSLANSLNFVTNWLNVQDPCTSLLNSYRTNIVFNFGCTWLWNLSRCGSTFSFSPQGPKVCVQINR